MFQGHANLNIDEKGRIIIPSKFRKHITADANSLMFVTLGRDNCLWLYPSNEWNKLVIKLQRQNAYTGNVIAMQRQMLYFAEECSIDTQHRILIPQSLLQKVNIKKEVLLLGLLDRIEIWNEKEYMKYLKSKKETYEDVMEKVMSNPEAAPEE